MLFKDHPYLEFPKWIVRTIKFCHVVDIVCDEKFHFGRNQQGNEEAELNHTEEQGQEDTNADINQPGRRCLMLWVAICATVSFSSLIQLRHFSMLGLL